MDIALSDEERIKILNADDLYGIMQKILLREQKDKLCLEYTSIP